MSRLQIAQPGTCPPPYSRNPRLLGASLRGLWTVSVAAFLLTSAFAPLPATGTEASGLAPNQIRYREQGAKPETGHDGGHTISTRSLLGADGNTTVEVSTGDLYDGAPPESGTHVVKVLFKMLTSNGETVYSEAHNQLENEGYWSISRPGMGRFQEYDIHALVGSDTTPRTFASKTTSRVYLRPDIQATGIQVPAEVYVGEPVEILGEIEEVNGDLGARVDCVLRVNGAEVARIPAIWVDAHDDAGCAFQHSFPEAGTAQIEVLAEGADPADDRPENNSTQTSVSVVPPVVPMTLESLLLRDYDQSYYYKIEYDIGPSGSYSFDRAYQTVIYVNTVDENVIPTANTYFRVLETSSGAGLEWSGQPDTSNKCSSNATWECHDLNDYVHNRFLTIRTAKGSPFSRITFKRIADKVIYHEALGAYSYYQGADYENGTRLPLYDGHYRIEIELFGDRVPLIASKEFELDPYHVNTVSPNPPACIQHPVYGQRCIELQDIRDGWIHN